MQSTSKTSYTGGNAAHPQAKSFEELGLKQELLQGICSTNADEMQHMVQKQCLDAVIKGRDSFILSRSSSGKTFSCIIGALQRIDLTESNLQVIMLYPTREHVFNVLSAVRAIAQFTETKSIATFGGIPLRENHRQLKEELYHLICGTPGRTLDAIQKGLINVSRLKMLIIDEFDEILGRGFNEQIKVILQSVPTACQLVLMSCTTSPEIEGFVNGLMVNPALITYDRPSLREIRHHFLLVQQQEQKLDAIVCLLHTLNLRPAIVYVNTGQMADQVVQHLHTHLIQSGLLKHGMAQEAEAVLRSLRNNEIDCVVCTDPELNNINHMGRLVISYDMPHEATDYHIRFERPLRFDRQHTYISMVMPRQTELLQEIQEYYDIRITEFSSNRI